ncbi:hypothetical protein E1287_30700 [Actinomadura sp. KC06]|uniref:hypothetical protein n=1 Tax=Actinomadura sp. KC06 TaxID=2530369 RepID=UPI0010532F8E|nr:hypothetical protein [Actinomadura sp. KC06]TDD29601.1 hypothetical protein E1287_30700 [Actinomadura sp. KC06]
MPLPLIRSARRRRPVINAATPRLGRRRGARIAAALVLATSIAGVGLSVGAAPASAGEYCYTEYLKSVCVEDVTVTAKRPNPFGPEIDLGFFGTIAVFLFGPSKPKPPRLPVLGAYQSTSDILTENTACADLLTGPNAVVYPDGTRRTAFTDFLFTRFEDTGLPGILDPLSGDFAYAAASGQGIGSGGTIRIFEPFLTVNDVGLFGGARLNRPPTRLDMQQLILLHELGHLTGVTEHKRNEIAPINAKIADVCLKMVSH